MAHYGILNDARVTEPTEDIRGSHLYGLNDEKLGKIDDVIFDHSTGMIRYVIVDTGGWLTSKEFIVPSEGLRASAKHTNDFEISLNKRQIESFPPFQESDLASESKWADYEGRYRSKWVTDPVMHRAETDRNITPTTPRRWEIPHQSTPQQKRTDTPRHRCQSIQPQEEPTPPQHRPQPNVRYPPGQIPW